MRFGLKFNGEALAMRDEGSLADWDLTVRQCFGLSLVDRNPGVNELKRLSDWAVALIQLQQETLGGKLWLNIDESVITYEELQL